MVVKKLDGGQRRDGPRPGPPGTAPLQGDSEAPGARSGAGGWGEIRNKNKFFAKYYFCYLTYKRNVKKVCFKQYI